MFDTGSISQDMWDKFYKYEFQNKLFIFLGEVPNAPGHCIMANLDSGKIIGLYHTENFREATEEEL